MAEAKNQTTTKPRTRTAKKTGTSAATAAKPTANATAKKTAVTKATAAKPTGAKADTKPEAKPATETAPRSVSETAPSPSAAEPAASEPAAAESKPAESKPVQSTQNADETGNRISVTIPLDGAVVGLAVKAATLPLTAAKKVAQNKNGIPAYVAVGGLAILGAVEWPVAAVGGLGLAALRRWGPLKPAQNQESARNQEPAANQESSKGA